MYHDRFNIELYEDAHLLSYDEVVKWCKDLYKYQVAAEALSVRNKPRLFLEKIKGLVQEMDKGDKISVLCPQREERMKVELNVWCLHHEEVLWPTLWVHEIEVIGKGNVREEIIDSAVDVILHQEKPKDFLIGRSPAGGGGKIFIFEKVKEDVYKKRFAFESGGWMVEGWYEYDRSSRKKRDLVYPTTIKW